MAVNVHSGLHELGDDLPDSFDSAHCVTAGKLFYLFNQSFFFLKAETVT